MPETERLFLKRAQAQRKIPDVVTTSPCDRGESRKDLCCGHQNPPAHCGPYGPLAVGRFGDRGTLSKIEIPERLAPGGHRAPALRSRGQRNRRHKRHAAATSLKIPRAHHHGDVAWARDPLVAADTKVRGYFQAQTVW